MRTIGKLASAWRAISAVVAACCVALPVMAQQPAGAGQITGHVVDASTQSAIAAAVGLIVDTPTTIDYYGFDAASGAFGFTNLPRGHAIITVHAEGYSPAWTEFVAVASSERTVRLGLKREAILTGVVVDGSGDPVAGAFVETIYSDEVGGYGLLDALTRGQLVTNARGEFSLHGVVADVAVTLQATTATGALSEAVSINTAAGMMVGNIVLTVP